MRLGVIGLGVVGKATHDVLALEFETVGYDLRAPFNSEAQFDKVADCDVIFICVPTPTINNKQDHTALFDVFGKLAQRNYNGVVVNKCTVQPGMTRYLAHTYNQRVVHNPEFLTAARPFFDFVEQKCVLLGGEYKDCRTVAAVYNRCLPKATVMFFTEEETEFAKYMRNVYLATKVTFANEIRELCEKASVDYEHVLEAMLSVGGIEKGHFRTPGPDGSIGYSGMCFPKDVKALIQYAETIGVKIAQIEATDASNDTRRPHDMFCKEIHK